MNLTDILYPVASIGGLGLVFGLALGYAGKIFKVEEDPRIGDVRACLPGANCGGCGFPGCDGFAQAVVAGSAPVNGCPVGGTKCAQAVGAVMGVAVEAKEKYVAYVKCAGNFTDAIFRYDYYGIADCRAVSMLAGGGSKQCAYGCLGSGSCVRACGFDALSLIDGIAKVDPEKCTACGMCVPKCPRKLIELVPYSADYRVGCNSLDHGKTVRANCKVGCISCKMCEKACNYDAVHVTNNLAKIDYDKCVRCGECERKCPTHCIKLISADNVAKEREREMQKDMKEQDAK